VLFKYWFRWILRIHKDLLWNEIIVEIQPNNYKVFCGFDKDNKILIRADFRTHEKFSKRIYHAFSWIWWSLHFLNNIGSYLKNYVVTERFIPNFGFDTLTKYPDPDPETSTVDGYVGRSASETFSGIRSGAGNVKSDETTPNYFFRLIGTPDSDSYTSMARSIFLFDTSTLTSAAEVASATFSVYAVDIGSTTPWTGYACHLCSSNPASNTVLANSDYSNLGSTSYGSSTTYSNNIWIDFVLNSSGISNISKTSISKFGLRSSWDINNSAPTGVYKNIKNECRFAEYTGSDYDPKLVILYSLWDNKFLGVAKASQSKINGVSIANVDSVMGVQ
jgi:hypothetical protein